MGRKPKGIGQKEEVRRALVVRKGEYITVDEMIALSGLSTTSANQQNRRSVIRVQIQRLRRDNGLNIDTQRTSEQRRDKKGNTAYRLVGD